MRLLIADDDDYARNGLLETIPWKKYGITDIRQAKDGREALDISVCYRPDIVLTDIKMPKLTGIEFAEKMIKECPDSKLLFMSGYLEIDYLKSAIQLAAVDFLEKPINLVKVENAVKKAVEFIDKNRKQSISNVEKKELQMQKLANSLCYKNQDREAIYHICDEIGYQLDSDYITAVIWDKAGTTVKEENIKNINKYWKQNKNESISAYMGDGKYVVIIKLKERELKKVYMLCKQLIEMDDNLCIGIVNKVCKLEDIPSSYEKAVININRSFYNLEKKLFLNEDENVIARTVDPNLYTEINEIIKNSPLNLSKWFEKFFSELYKKQCYKKEQVQTLVFNFVKIIIENKKSIITLLDNMYSEADIESYIMSSTSIFQLKNFVMCLTEKYENAVEQDFKFSKLVRDIIQYIEAHYMEADLGVEDIAKHMHFSSAHLSVLFKHETGITIKQHIGDYRLKLSKEMLTNEHYKINEIAELCGYSNGNYFAKVFKADTCMSPLEYRKKYIM